MFQRVRDFERPNKENIFGEEVHKINNHYKSDHDLKVVVNLNSGLQWYFDVMEVK